MIIKKITEEINNVEKAIKHATTIEECVSAGNKIVKLRYEIYALGCEDEIFDKEALNNIDDLLSKLDELDSEAQDTCEEIIESNRKVEM